MRYYGTNVMQHLLDCDLSMSHNIRRTIAAQ